MDQLRQKVGDKRLSMSFGPDQMTESVYAARSEEMNGATAAATEASEAGQKSSVINDEDIYVYGDEWSSDDDDGSFRSVVIAFLDIQGFKWDAWRNVLKIKRYLSLVWPT